MADINERYKRGKIYTVRCYDDNNHIFVGSTIQSLSQRMARHRSDYNCSLYKFVNGNWNNWYIELYENFPCNNKQELEKREGEVIREIGNVNVRVAGRTQKERYEKNREKLNEYHKLYYQKNREKLIEKQKEYYKINRDEIRKKQNEYYQKNS